MTTKKKEIRNQRLFKLMHDRFEGSQSRLAEHLGIVPNLVSRYLSGKGIGEDMKVKIETACGLNNDWLDGVDSENFLGIDESSLTEVQIKAIKKIAAMSPDEAEAMMAILKIIKKNGE